MSNIINLNKRREQQKSNDRSRKKQQKNYHYEFSFKVDYTAEELYINIKFAEYDINVDVGVNLGIIDSLIKKNPMTRVTKDLLQEITALDPPYVLAIHEVYKAYGFIDEETYQVRSMKDIVKMYVKRRLAYGYPKEYKKFEKIMNLEKKVFNKYVKGLELINKELYWKAENKY